MTTTVFFKAMANQEIIVRQQKEAKCFEVIRYNLVNCQTYKSTYPTLKQAKQKVDTICKSIRKELESAL